jgi:hypothetical protein
MTTGGFFEERSDQSRVKAELVEKYFFAWVNVLKKSIGDNGRLAYIDLFCRAWPLQGRCGIRPAPYP